MKREDEKRKEVFSNFVFLPLIGNSREYVLDEMVIPVLYSGRISKR